jgi:hypothetical protein
MTALGDVYDVDEAANALVNASSELRTAVTAAERAVSELERCLVGETGNSVQRIWSAASGPAGTLATVTYGVGKGAEEVWKHRKGIEHAASTAWNDATGWL